MWKFPALKRLGRKIRAVSPGQIDVTDLLRARVKDNRLEIAPDDPLWDELNRLWDQKFWPDGEPRKKL